LIEKTLNLDVQILSNIITNFTQIFISYAGQIIGATLILIIGFYIAGKLGRLTKNNLEKFKKLDPLIVPILGNIVRYGIIIVTIIAVLGQFGVQTTSIIAVLGAAGLAIGLALQGTLSNVAAGVMLLLLRPFSKGDWVETGNISGIIKEVGLFTTIINTFDNVFVSIPNSNIWNSVILNHSHNHTRRIDIEIGVDYDANMDVVSKTLLDLTKDKRVLSLPKKPEFLIVKYDDSAIIVRLRLYSNTNNWYALYSDLMKKLKPALDKAGIEIPYPQRVIHTKSN
tara:strand:+ start:437 stop:1282 length:846 start_codon:yes stop_codon:yes gene_type:complete